MSLTTVRLLGSLGQKYGREHRLNVRSPRHAAKLLAANYPGFRADLLQGNYRVITPGDGPWQPGDDLGSDALSDPHGASEILIVPVIEGAGGNGFFGILAGIALIGLAGPLGGLGVLGLTASSYTLVGASLILGGISSLLSPSPAAPTASEKSDPRSFVFNGLSANTSQGDRVPVVYGLWIVPGLPISGSVATDQLAGVTDLEMGTGGGGFGGGDPLAGEGGSPPAPSAPSIEEDNLETSSRATTLDLLCEGEISGLVDGAKSIYLDETPIQAADDSFNFKGFAYEFRVGTNDQTTIPDFGDTVENEIAVNTELTIAGGPVVRTITDLDVDSVRVRVQIPQLQQIQEDGSIEGDYASWEIEISDNGGPYVSKANPRIYGKSSVAIERDTLVPLDGTGPWSVRVSRFTFYDSDQIHQNRTIWVSYTEVKNIKLTYPNSAILGMSFDAQHFSSIPARAYKIKGLKIRIPSNATVAADGGLTYAGSWDGLFITAWCADPAWIFYDLLTTGRYGAGINSASIDETELYAISQYCNETLDDGFGGTQKRYLCHAYLRSATDAYELLKALTSVFRGSAYWDGSTIAPIQDRPASAVYQFTQANVVDGTFTYSGTALRARHTVALITWNDPEDFYRQKIEVYEDQAGVALYGWRPLEITAFGCTSRGQAYRAGKWAIVTEQLETETVSFTTGAQGALVAPGDVIQIYDRRGVTPRWGGRAIGATATTLTTDAPITIGAGVHTLYVILPDGTLATATLTNSAGATSTLTFAALAQIPSVGAVWIVSPTSDPTLSYWKVLARAEVEGNYEITAIQYESSKYAVVEQNLILEPLDTVRVPKPPSPPTSVGAFVAVSYPASGTAYTLTVTWSKPQLSGSDDPYTVRYLTEFQTNGGSWGNRLSVTARQADWVVSPGTYLVRVAAIDLYGNQSAWVESNAITADQANLVYQLNSISHSLVLGVI